MTDKMTQQKNAEAEAIKWLVKTEHGPLREQEENAFQTWIKQSDAHKAAFDTLHSTWDMMTLTAFDKATTETPLSSQPQRSWAQTLVEVFTSLQAPKPVLAATTLLAISVFTFAYWDTGNPSENGLNSPKNITDQFATAVGEQSDHTLKDGSSIRLNTNTQLTAQMTSDSRRINLLNGEAFFNVSHDPSRPFVIKAGAHEVTVLGTKFSVYKHSAIVEVSVQSGHVSVRQIGEEQTTPVTLLAGQKVIASKKTGFGNIQHPDPDQAFAWTNGLLFFDNVSLPNALLEIERYFPRNILLRCSTARIQRISGIFRIDNMEEAFETLKKSAGVQADTVTEKSLILRCAAD